MRKSEATKVASWTFLTNHTHVLICIAREPEALLKVIAVQVGITERAVQRIISELVAEGYLTRERAGRRNKYTINKELPLRHPTETHCKVGGLIAFVVSKGKKI